MTAAEVKFREDQNAALLVMRARIRLACWAIKGSLALAELYSVLMPEDLR